MSLAARYVQQPYDVRKRVLDYDDWLQAGETITGVTVVITPETDPLFTITPIAIDSNGRKFAYWAGNGLVDTSYQASFRITTSNGQQREDEVEFEVEEL